MIVQFHETALKDIDSIAAYIARDNREAAARFYELIDETAEIVRRTPGIGTVLEPKKGSPAGIRRLVLKRFRHYLLYYVQDAETITVIRVLHGAQDRDRLFTPDV